MLFQLANLFMKGVSLLGADIESGATEVANTVVSTVKSIIVPVLLILGAAGMIWAIVLGVNMARADSTEKREEAKKRLISLIVGIVIMIVLIFFFLFGFEPLLKAFGVDRETITTEPGGTGTMIKSFLQLTNLM